MIIDLKKPNSQIAVGGRKLTPAEAANAGHIVIMQCEDGDGAFSLIYILKGKVSIVTQAIDHVSEWPYKTPQFPAVHCLKVDIPAADVTDLLLPYADQLNA